MISIDMIIFGLGTLLVGVAVGIVFVLKVWDGKKKRKKDSASRMKNIIYDMNEKYPELNIGEGGGGNIFLPKLNAYYRLENMKSQKIFNRFIIVLQVFNIILIGILIYVTWIKQ